MSQTASIPVGLPSADDVQLSTGGATWRFSKGKIVTGRDADGTLQERASIIGILKRTGVHEGVTNDEFKRKIAQVEADFETSDGVVWLKAGLLSSETELLGVTRSVVDFAWGLSQTPPDTLVMITTAQGEAWTQTEGPKRGTQMAGSTYVNFARLEPDPKREGKWIAKPMIKPKRDPNAPKVPMNDQWLELEKVLRARSDFAPRPNARPDEVDHEDGTVGGRPEDGAYMKLCALMKERGWPQPDQAPAEWLTLMAKALHGKDGTPLATLAAHSSADWYSMLTALQGLGQIPGLLAPAKTRLDAAAAKPVAAVAATPDFDPFA